MSRNLIFSLAALWIAASVMAEWQVPRSASMDDLQVPGRVNVALKALPSGSNSYSTPPWSYSSINSAGDYKRFGKNFANENADLGWNAGTNSAIDANPTYVQLDFRGDAPVAFDRIALVDCPVPATRGYRAPYVIERRLGGEWSEIFKPRNLAEANSPFIEFNEPIQADAVRVRFIAAAPNIYWNVARLWVYAVDEPTVMMPEAQITIRASEAQALTEGEVVFAPEANCRLQLTVDGACSTEAKRPTINWRIADYYREPLPQAIAGRVESGMQPVTVIDIDAGKLPPGPYYLLAELTDGERVLARGEKLFGVAGIQPMPAALSRFAAEELLPIRFEVAGATGQFDGAGVHKSPAMVDAFDALNANTIQVEMFWRDLEPLPGVYNFAEMDRIVEYALSKGKWIGITIYLGDDQTPGWLTQERYATLDQYGVAAWGRNDWKMMFFRHPSVHYPGYLEHLAKVWELTAERYTPTGRVLRFDPRPPLLEVFYFDDYVNELWNNGATDSVWDYSDWSVQAFAAYLRDTQKWTLAEVNARYQSDWKSWAEVTLPQPLPLKERKSDLRAHWLDFQAFKYEFTPRKYYLALVEAINRHNTQAAIFCEAPGGELFEALESAGRLTEGNFSIEFGLAFFALNAPENKAHLCYEWGEPAPTYYHFNAGLFYILPKLAGNSLRWVAPPCMGGAEYSAPDKWPAWNGLAKIAPLLERLAEYTIEDHPQIAISGGSNYAHMAFEDAKPIRQRRNASEWDRWVLAQWGGVAGMLKVSNFYSGLPMYEWMSNYDRLHPTWRLIIDGGHPECPLDEQQNALAFVRGGGKALMWSNSFQRSGQKETTLWRDALRLQYGSDQPNPESQMLQFTLPGETTFEVPVYQVYDLEVPDGRVVGTIDGKAAAWLIQAGDGEVLLVNGLPEMPHATTWTPFMDAVARWAKVSPNRITRLDTEFDKMPNLLSYAMGHPENDSKILVLYNCSPLVMTGEVTFKGLLEAGRTPSVQPLHSTEPESVLQAFSINGSDLRVQVSVQPLDMLLLEVR